MTFFSNPARPLWFLVCVVAMTTLALFGAWLVSTSKTEALPTDRFEITRRYEQMRGPLMHTALQCTGASIALLTAITAFNHSRLRRDQTTGVMGAAFFYAGLIDTFHIIYLDRFFPFLRIDDPEQFGPFTWAIARISHASIVALGTVPHPWARAIVLGRSRRSGWLLVASCAIMAVGTFAIIQVCAVNNNLPEALRPHATVLRPWDAVALMVYLLGGGILLPRFHFRHVSLFSYGLLLSLLPHMLGQFLVAFESSAPFDSAFMAGQMLKIVGYLVPLLGLLVDYTQVYRAQAELRATQEKLQIAREIQQGLLPTESPHLSGYAVAGVCIPTDAVGGDFFDYVPMANGRVGIVIADVSGHDLAAGIHMAQARAYLRSEAAYSGDPADLLERVNHFLCHDVRDRRFISMAILVVDQNSETIRYAAAGHPVYCFTTTRPEEPKETHDSAPASRQSARLTRPSESARLVRPSESARLSRPSESARLRLPKQAGSRFFALELPPTGPVLGVTELEYAEGTPIKMRPGEILLLMTDGWSEATSPQLRALGTQPIFDLIADRADAAPDAILTALHELVLNFCGKTPPEDDLTAIVVKRTQGTRSEIAITLT